MRGTVKMWIMEYDESAQKISKALNCFETKKPKIPTIFCVLGRANEGKKKTRRIVIRFFTIVSIDDNIVFYTHK